MAEPTSLVYFLQVKHPKISPSCNFPPSLSSSAELNRQSAPQVAAHTLFPHPQASPFSTPHSEAQFTYPHRFPDEGFVSGACADSEYLRPHHDADAHGHEHDDVDCVHPSYTNMLLGDGKSENVHHEAELHAYDAYLAYSHADRHTGACIGSDNYMLSNYGAKSQSDERDELDYVHLRAHSYANAVAGDGDSVQLHHEAELHADEGYFACATDVDWHADACVQSFRSSGLMDSVHLFETPLSPCSSTSSTLTITEVQDSRGSAQADEDEGSFEIHGTAGDELMENLDQTGYCALDVCGQVPCRLNLSSTWPQPKFSKFKSWQDVDRQWRVLSKPYKSPSPPWGLLRNPWVNHFRHQDTPPIKATCKRFRIDINIGEGHDARKRAASTQFLGGQLEGP